MAYTTGEHTKEDASRKAKQAELRMAPTLGVSGRTARLEPSSAFMLDGKPIRKNNHSKAF